MYGYFKCIFKQGRRETCYIMIFPFQEIHNIDIEPQIVRVIRPRCHILDKYLRERNRGVCNIFIFNLIHLDISTFRYINPQALFSKQCALFSLYLRMGFFVQCWRHCRCVKCLALKQFLNKLIRFSGYKPTMILTFIFWNVAILNEMFHAF